MITFEQRDCMEALAEFPDKYFDLAIVDPPYGDGKGGSGAKRFGGMFGASINGAPTRGTYNRFGGRFEKYIDPQPADDQDGQDLPKLDRRGGGWATKYGKRIVKWDVEPGPEYFAELFRVAKNSIIWGGNYFTLPPSRCFVVWRKTNIPAQGFSMAPVEYAWTSYQNRNAVYLEANSQGSSTNIRFHPTQKPVELYKDLLYQFAKPGYKILDTHAGSASSLVACYDMGFDAWGYEIDETYYTKAKARLEEVMSQVRIEDLQISL